MNRQSIANLISNVISFSLSMGISLWMVPFMIGHLGAEAYGFIPLMQQMVNYMSVITIALNSMIGRFFTIAVKTGDWKGAEEYFNTSLFSSMGLVLMLIGPIFLLSAVIGSVLNVPSGLLGDVRLTILLFGGVFLLSTLSTSFSVAPFCTNRLYLTSIIQAVNVMLRSLMTVVLLALLTPRIWFVSIGFLCAYAVTLGMTMGVFRHVMPQIRIALNRFNIMKLKEMLYSGMWMSVNWIGSILFLQINLLIANWNLGAKLAGEYAAVIQWSTMLRVFSGTVTSIFFPTILSLYAKNEMRALVQYCNRAVKWTGFMMALPVGLVCGMGGSVLKLWIGGGFEKYHLLMALMTIHLTINLAVQSLFALQSATNKVRTPAVVTLMMGACNFGLALFLSGIAGLGVYGIVLTEAIILTAKNSIFTPIYGARITSWPWYTYYGGMVQPFIATLFVAVLGFMVQWVLGIHSGLVLLVIAALISILYVIVVYFIFLNEEDRGKLQQVFDASIKIFRKVE